MVPGSPAAVGTVDTPGLIYWRDNGPGRSVVELGRSNPFAGGEQKRPEGPIGPDQPPRIPPNRSRPTNIAA
jgi:hypothetical protein